MRNVRHWSKEETDKAIELFNQNYSSSKIASTMNEEGWRSDCPKITRNAIIGLLHRNGCMRDKKIKLIKNVKEVKEIKKVKKSKIAVEEAFEEPTAKVEVQVEEKPSDHLKSIINLEYNECRYPEGDIRDDNLLFCGKEIDFSLGRSYCAHHYRLCYYPARGQSANAQNRPR